MRNDGIGDHTQSSLKSPSEEPSSRFFQVFFAQGVSLWASTVFSELIFILPLHGGIK